MLMVLLVLMHCLKLKPRKAWRYNGYYIYVFVCVCGKGIYAWYIMRTRRKNEPFIFPILKKIKDKRKQYICNVYCFTLLTGNLKINMDKLVWLIYNLHMYGIGNISYTCVGKRYKIKTYMEHISLMIFYEHNLRMCK